MRSVMVIVLLFLLAGCSPDYNWRQVSLADSAVSALFPDRPVTQTREIDFSGHHLQYSLTTATVDGALFGIGVALLSPALKADSKTSHELASAVAKSLYHNLGIEPPDQLPALGETFTINGKAQGSPVRVRARVLLSGHAVVQSSVTAAVAQFPEDQATEFLNGVTAGD
jgi:hypothetical protein